MSDFMRLRDELLRDRAIADGYRAQKDALKIGRLLQQARKSAGLSQAEAAGRASIDQSEISRIESGGYSKGPTFETLVRYAHSLGMNLVIELAARTETALSNPPSADLTLREVF